MERKRSTRNRRYKGGGGGMYPREKSTCTKIKDFLREFVAFMFSNVGIIGLVVGYTICGAFMFRFIENSDANVERTQAIHSVLTARHSTAKRMWEITHELSFAESEDEWKRKILQQLADYQAAVIGAQSKGYDGNDEPEGQSASASQWTFSGAFLYSLTVITTVGYGNVAPKTDWGKIATIFYTIIGMPLFLLYLSNISDIMAKSFKWSYAKCCLCRGCGSGNNEITDRRSITPENTVGIQVPELWPEDEIQQQHENSTSDRESIPQDETVTVPVTLCLTIMVSYVLGGAVLFCSWEDWDLLDGAYFCFISLSTIGFGDIVPGDKIYASNSIDISFIFCSMYLMLGMAIIAMCFSLMQEEVIHKFRMCVRAIKNCFTCGAAAAEE